MQPHFHGLYSSFEFCCEGRWFTSIEEDRCNKEAQQSYLERNIPAIPNWFQPCQCCCCLWCPGQYLRLRTLISSKPRNFKLVIVSSFCPFTLVSVLMPLVLFVISLVFSTLWGLCRITQLILPVLLPPLLSHSCQQNGDWWFFCLQCWQCLRDLLRRLSWSFPEICWRAWVRVDIPIELQLLFGTSLLCCCWRGLH